jgi:hypothetical protein
VGLSLTKKVYDWYGRGEWTLIDLDRVGERKAEKDYYITWQIYTDDDIENGKMLGDFVCDFDSENLDHARIDTLEAYKTLINKQVNPKNVRILFSGAKGFHLELDHRSYMASPVYDLGAIYKKIAVGLRTATKHDTMDMVIYNSKRLWRYPNTINSKTGLYCTYITPQELEFPIDEITKLCKAKRNFTFSYVPDEVLKKNMLGAFNEYVNSRNVFRSKISQTNFGDYKYMPCIQDILDNGVDEGSRNVALYILACVNKHKNVKVEDAEQILSGWGMKSCLNEKEVVATVRSAYRSDKDGVSCSNYILRERCRADKCTFKAKEDPDTTDIYIGENYYTLTYQQGHEMYFRRMEEGYFDRVCRTGFDFLDEHTKITRDTLLVVGANTSIGKSTFMATLCHNMCAQGLNVLYFPLEESIDRAMYRLIRMEFSDNGKLNIIRPKKGRMPVDDIEKFIKRYGADMVLIDQLTWMDSPVKTSEERLKYKSLVDSLHGIVTSNNPVPIITLHQLGRASLNRDMPIKEDLAEGADIERTASDVWLLYTRRIKDEPVTKLNIDKNRFGKRDVQGYLKLDIDKLIFMPVSEDKLNEYREHDKNYTAQEVLPYAN